VFIKLIFLVAALAVFYAFAKWFIKTPPQHVAKLIRHCLIGIGILVLLFLFATGRLHWLFALLASLIPFASKALPLLRTIMQFRNLSQTFKDKLHPDWRKRHKHDSQDNNENHAPSHKNTMDREEAYAILGITPDATAEEIKQAHHRLIQKVHPDRDGSSYLAAKINLAKDLLLKKPTT